MRRSPILLVAISPEARDRFAQQGAELLTRLPETEIILLTSSASLVAPIGVGEVWRDGDRRGASAFLARMRRLSWAGFGAVYDFDATFFKQRVSGRPHRGGGGLGRRGQARGQRLPRPYAPPVMGRFRGGL